MSALELLYRLAVLRRLDDRPGPFDPAGVRKILVLRTDNIGDVICTTPALDALRAAFPQARLAAVVCSLTEEAISGHPALDVLYSYPKAKHKQAGHLRSLWLLGKVIRDIRREQFDLAVSFRTDFSTSQGWLAYASRARWRLGVEARGRKQRWGFFHNMSAPPVSGHVHEVLRCFDLLSRLPVDSSEKRLYLKVPLTAGQRAERFLAENGLTRETGPVVLNVTRWAYRPDRLWPAENYRNLARMLIRRGHDLVITHAPADADWVKELLADLDPAPPVFCSASLKEFAAMLARGRAVITAEGGPMHLAAAVGAPLVVLWGVTPLEMWRPWGVAHRIVGGQGPVRDISEDRVVASLDDLLLETASLPPKDKTEAKV